MKILIAIFFLFFVFCVSAQEPLMPKLQEQDSTTLEAERNILYRQFMAGISPVGELMKPVKIPEFNFNDAAFRRWNYNLADYSFNQGLFNGFNHRYSGFSAMPFLRNGTVFSEGSYQLNKKFKLGGYSFGGNSIFSAPFPNQNLNDFDFRGSTIFMEYKVSDKFKIQTSVSVSQGK